MTTTTTWWIGVGYDAILRASWMRCGTRADRGNVFCEALGPIAAANAELAHIAFAIANATNARRDVLRMGTSSRAGVGEGRGTSATVSLRHTTKHALARATKICQTFGYRNVASSTEELCTPPA